jgi:hypothetical protein
MVLWIRFCTTEVRRSNLFGSTWLPNIQATSKTADTPLLASARTTELKAERGEGVWRLVGGQ